MNSLKRSHSFLDFIYWILFAFIPIFTACLAIFRHSIFWMIIYLVVLCADFAIIVYRFFCTHCPHYINNPDTTKCMFIWGLPKYFKERPGPLSNFERFMSLLGFAIAIIPPVYWLVGEIPLLIIYIVSWCLIITTIKRCECSRCIHFHCPSNTVPQKGDRGPKGVNQEPQ